jgi:hypothetical protein
MPISLAFAETVVTAMPMAPRIARCRNRKVTEVFEPLSNTKVGSG